MKSRLWDFLRPVGHFVRKSLQWIGIHEFNVLVALMLLVGSVWAFVELADEVVEGSTKPFDEWAIRTLRRQADPSQPIGPSWLAEVGRDLTALGGTAFLTLLTATIAGFLWIRRMYGALALLLAATIGGLIASLMLKQLFDRPRPQLVPHLSIVHTSSFPSGHSMLSAAVYLTLGALLGQFVHERVLKAYFLIVALMLTTLVGISRVYMGVHYPTDVLTGWTGGLAWALICWLAARYLQRQHVVETEFPPTETADQV
jgi:undecaprenyl-diphosphatase